MVATTKHRCGAAARGQVLTRLTALAAGCGLALAAGCVVEDATFTAGSAIIEPDGAEVEQVARLEVEPNQLYFNEVLVDDWGRTPFTITNTGTAPSGVPIVTMDGADRDRFGQSYDCPGPLAPGASCVVWVRFAPTRPGVHQAQALIAAEPGGPAAVGMYGNALTPAVLQADPVMLAFPATPVGMSARAIEIHIRNTGTARAAPAMVQFDNPEFQFLAHGCANPIEGGGHCAVLVQFTPSATGNRTGTLTVTSMSGETARVALSGVGR